MKRIVLGVADQVLLADLISRIEALEDYEVVHVSESTQELIPAVLNHNPDVLLVDRHLPPGPLTRTTSDLALRRPALPIILLTNSHDEESLSLALEVGARAVLSYPFVLAEVNNALTRSTEWAERMLEVLDGRDTSESTDGGIICFAGSKGGVGTTILTSHLGWRLAQLYPDKRICLVDLDLEKGDITNYIDLTYRVSIVDLAKIADDITERVIRDTVAVHESGLHILPAPLDVRDVDAVNASAIRSIVGQLRQMYDVVLVDAGSNVTPAQAAAVEMSDQTVQIITTDVPSLRAARRQAQAWTDLGVRGAGDIKVLVNKFSRNSEIQQSTIDRLAMGERCETLIPDLERGLEAAINTRTPSQGVPRTWWRALDAIAGEVEIVSAAEQQAMGRGVGRGFGRALLPTRSGSTAVVQNPPPAEEETAEAAEAKPRRGLRRAERGQASLETIGVFPITVILLLVLWQVVGLGLSFVWAGHAANAAARTASLGGTTSQVQQAARDAVPGAFHGGMQITSSSGQVKVRLKIAPIGSGMSSSDLHVNRSVVREP